MARIYDDTYILALYIYRARIFALVQVYCVSIIFGLIMRNHWQLTDKNGIIIVCINNATALSYFLSQKEVLIAID